MPTAWYQWNGSQYVKVSLTGTAGDLGTLQSDLVGNNQTNTAAVDLYDFVATAPTSGVSTYSPQAAINAAAANNGSAIIQPGAGRTPFTNPGNYRVQDNRSDVPATARSVTEDGAQCDVRTVYGTLTQGSTTFPVQAPRSPQPMWAACSLPWARSAACRPSLNQPLSRSPTRCTGC